MSTTIISGNDIPTPDELAESMRNISENADQEFRHRAMDSALTDVLEALGYTEAVKIFYETPKWYA